MNPAANGECGAWANPNFQNSVQTTRVDPAVLSGWGVRPYNWQYSVGVQQQIAPRMSVDVSWSRRQWGNFFVTDNAANSASDYTIATIPAPANPTLADNGYTTVSFPVISAAKFGLTDNYYTKDSNYGNSSYYWSGFDVTFNARTTQRHHVPGRHELGRRPSRLLRGHGPAAGTAQRARHVSADRFLQGGRTLADERPRPRLLHAAQGGRAHQRVGPLHGERAAGDDVRGRRDERSVALGQLQRAERGRAGGDRTSSPRRRGRAGGGSPLPGQIYGDRINAVDMRFAKILRFGRTRTNIGIDLYNLFNANTGTAFNQTFAERRSAWLRPTTVLNPRFLRFNVTFDF